MSALRISNIDWAFAGICDRSPEAGVKRLSCDIVTMWHDGWETYGIWVIQEWQLYHARIGRYQALRAAERLEEDLGWLAVEKPDLAHMNLLYSDAD